MKSNLKVNFLGTELINPFILASAPPTKDYETIRNAFNAGWAGAITKSIVLSPTRNKKSRIGHIRHQNNIIATQNYEMSSVYSPYQWKEWVIRLRNEFPDRLIFVSFAASSNIDEWKFLSESFLETNVHGLELNFSCPHSDHDRKGSAIGLDHNLCASITEAVKKTVGKKLKIMSKLPYILHPNEGTVAKMCIEAGADAIAGINSIAGLCEIDPYELKPKLMTGDKTTTVGLSYHIIRSFGRLVITQIAKTIDWKRYPISAIGGVSRDIESIIDYLSLGANHMQVCSEVMNHGVEVIDEMKATLLQYLEKTGRTIDDIRGKALPHFTEWDKLDSQDRIATVSDDCTNCQACISYCRYNAIMPGAAKINIVDKNCDGCGSCYSACPNNAISLN